MLSFTKFSPVLPFPIRAGILCYGCPHFYEAAAALTHAIRQPLTFLTDRQTLFIQRIFCLNILVQILNIIIHALEIICPVYHVPCEAFLTDPQIFINRILHQPRPLRLHLHIEV